MLSKADLWHHKDFWVKVVSMACYWRTCLHTSLLNSKLHKKSDQVILLATPFSKFLDVLFLHMSTIGN